MNEIAKQNYYFDTKRFHSVPAWVRKMAVDLYGVYPDDPAFVLPYEFDIPMSQKIKEVVTQIPAWQVQEIKDFLTLDVDALRAETVIMINDVVDTLNLYQLKLYSGANIKTINGASILGAGNIEIAVNEQIPALVFDSGAQLNDWCYEVYIRPDGVTPADAVIGQILLTRNTDADYWVSRLPIIDIRDDLTEINASFNLANYYTVAQVNDIVADKAETVLVDEKLALKATKTEVQSGFSDVAGELVRLETDYNSMNDAINEINNNKATDFSVVNDTKYPTTKAVREHLLNLPIAELNNHTLKEVFGDNKIEFNVKTTNSFYSSPLVNITPTQGNYWVKLLWDTPINWSGGGMERLPSYAIDPNAMNVLMPSSIINLTGSTNYRFILANTSLNSIDTNFVVYMIDLTTLGIFEQMDYWFSVYQALLVSDTNAIFTLFAPKQQEAWITPTLINGSTGNVKYMKDSLGFVHFKGSLTSVIPAISNNIMLLPAGYRPSNQDNLFPVVKDDFVTLSTFLISKNGGVLCGIQGTVFLDNITFKAEA